jgi:hypothetical protein
VRVLFKVELQHFDSADERAACAWLEAQPTGGSRTAADIDIGGVAS